MISIEQIKQQIQKEGVEKVVKEAIAKTKKIKNQNFLITLAEKQAVEEVKKVDISKPLAGIPYFEKDNVSTKGIRTTGSSGTLDNYIPPFDATSYQRIRDAGAILIGKTSLDEFAMGGVGLFSYKGFVENYLDKNRITGGSSSGSTFAVAAGLVPFATGSDTGDSIRKPASFAGIVGYKPTYGSISRYGIFPYAPSLDHMGILTTNVDDAYLLSSIMIGYDEKDATSAEFELNYNKEKLNKKLRFAHIEQAFNDQKDFIKAKYEKLNDVLKKQGHTVDLIKFDQSLLDILESVYMVLSFAEAVSSHAGVDGINFGVRAKGEGYTEVMYNSRGKGFGQNTKKRYILGILALQNKNINDVFNKAKKIRRLICDELDKVFKKYDILIIPPARGCAPTIDETLNGPGSCKKHNYLDNILGLGNMNGMPSITIPFTTCNGLPIGINLNAKHFNDEILCKAGLMMEELIRGLE